MKPGRPLRRALDSVREQYEGRSGRPSLGMRELVMSVHEVMNAYAACRVCRDLCDALWEAELKHETR